MNSQMRMYRSGRSSQRTPSELAFVFSVIQIKGSLDYSCLGNLIIWKAYTMEVTFGKIRAERHRERLLL